MSDSPSTDPEVRRRLMSAFNINEQKLQLALDESRADFNHAGMKGDSLERAVRALLRGHLPRVFDVGTGEVIDRLGNRSPQLDVLIPNQYQPFVHPIDTPGLYLAEGVSAVGEVKASLTSSSLDDILAKGTSIRRLRPLPSVGDTVYGNPTDIDRFVMTLPYFAVAIESTLSADSIRKKLEEAPLIPATTGSGALLPPLDALFVLDQGMSALYFSEGGSAQLLADSGETVWGWGSVGNHRPLTELFLWLNHNAAQVNRVQPIIGPYLHPQSVEELEAWRAQEAEADGEGPVP